MDATLASLDNVAHRQPSPNFVPDFASVVAYEPPLGVGGDVLILQSGLKASMAYRIRTYVPQRIRDATETLVYVFNIKFRRRLSLSILSYAVLDEGLFSRVEFKFPGGVSGNARFAYFGDSLLTAYIAKACLRSGCSPSSQQILRTATSSKTALADFFDCYFHMQSPPAPITKVFSCTWDNFLAMNVSMTAHQKAEFVEAIIGVFAYFNLHYELNEFLHSILYHRYSCQPLLTNVIAREMVPLIPISNPVDFGMPKPTTGVLKPCYYCKAEQPNHYGRDCPEKVCPTCLKFAPGHNSEECPKRTESPLYEEVPFPVLNAALVPDDFVDELSDVHLEEEGKAKIAKKF